MLQAIENRLLQLVSPQVTDYDINDLGSPNCKFGQTQATRIDFQVCLQNNRNLKSSIFTSNNLRSSSCIIYLHGHSGNRLEGLQLAKLIVPKMAFCIFDFCGSGKSTRDFVTLGDRESIDLHELLHHLNHNYGIKEFYLWGRSMGAVTAMLYVTRPLSFLIKGMVLDSPFTDAKTMVPTLLTYQIADIATSQMSIPSLITKTALLAIQSRLEGQTGYDVLGVSPIQCASSIHTPVYIIGAEQDIIVPLWRLEEMFGLIATSDKVFRAVQGEHNSDRSQEVTLDALSFLLNHASKGNSTMHKRRDSQFSTLRDIQIMKLRNISTVSQTVGFDPIKTKRSHNDNFIRPKLLSNPPHDARVSLSSPRPLLNSVRPACALRSPRANVGVNGKSSLGVRIFSDCLH